jgi:hypothetical protein
MVPERSEDQDHWGTRVSDATVVHEGAIAVDARTRARPRLAALRRDLAAVGVLVAVGLLCLYPALGARFVLVDDHEILVGTMADPRPPQAEPPLDLQSVLLRYDPAGGRFRPLYWVVRLAEIRLLADDPAAWHGLVVGLGLASASLLFATARRLGLPTPAALGLAVWLLVAPGVSSVWVRLGPQETIGTVFLVLSVFGAAMAARARHGFAWDCLYVVAGVGCVLCKESLALAAPALAGFRVLVSNERGRWPGSQARVPGGTQDVPPGARSKRLRVGRLGPPAALVLGSGLLVGAGAARIGAAAGPASYGGRYFDLPTISAYGVDLLANTYVLVLASGAWLLGLAAWARRPAPPPTDRARALACSAIVALCVVPQLLVYSKVGRLEGRYELPAALALAGGTTAGLVWLLADARPPARRLVASVAGLVLVVFGFWTWTYAAAFAEDSRQLAALVRAVADTTPADATLGVVADPLREFEPVRSLVDHVAHAGRGDVRVVVLPLPSRAGSALAPGQLEQLRQAGLLDDGEPPTATCGRVGAIVVLPDEVASSAPLPCPPAGWEQDDFTGSVLQWGRDLVPVRPDGPRPASVTYRLLRPR